MARPFTGQGSLEAARKGRDEACTAAELRIALAVLLPLEAGLTLAQTALVLGRPRHTTCALRTDFCARASGQRAPRRKNQNCAIAPKARCRPKRPRWTQRWPALPKVPCWSSRASKTKSRPSWATAFPSRACTACWRAMAGARWRPTLRTRKATRRRAKIGKKTLRRPGASARPVPRAAAHPGDVSGRGAVWPHQRAAPLLVQKALAPARQSHAHARVRVCLRGPSALSMGALTPWCCPTSTPSACSYSSMRSPAATRTKTSSWSSMAQDGTRPVRSSCQATCGFTSCPRIRPS
jgi:hypothetical protein